MKTNDWKDRLNIVYSTNPDYSYDTGREEEAETLSPSQQMLRLTLDKRNRNGKAVTLVSGFIGTEDDLKSLGRMLKGKCGCGGSVKDGCVIIQGDFREKLSEILRKEGYRVK